MLHFHITTVMSFFIVLTSLIILEKHWFSQWDRPLCSLSTQLPDVNPPNLTSDTGKVKYQVQTASLN